MGNKAMQDYNPVVELVLEFADLLAWNQHLHWKLIAPYSLQKGLW
jgi:hypothetical protein